MESYCLPCTPIPRSQPCILVSSHPPRRRVFSSITLPSFLLGPSTKKQSARKCPRHKQCFLALTWHIKDPRPSRCLWASTSGDRATSTPENMRLRFYCTSPSLLSAPSELLRSSCLFPFLPSTSIKMTFSSLSPLKTTILILLRTFRHSIFARTQENPKSH